VITHAPDLLEAYAQALEPPEPLTPSQWAEAYRILSDRESERPGRWSNNHFPALGPIMDTIAEAIETGRNWVMMKSAQAGGSQAMINIVGWMLTQYGGNFLYLISIDRHAKEFGRERFDPMLRTAKPLKRKFLTERGDGTTIQTKRLVNGKIDILGGQSAKAVESQSYRGVAIDEPDSLRDDMGDFGSYVHMAIKRTNAIQGPKLVWAFSHPTTANRGSGLLYYGRQDPDDPHAQHVGGSDQRRGFVRCIHCENELWLQWDHVRVVPAPDQTKTEAERDPACYRYVCPHCEREITDAQRYIMLRAGIVYRSTLPPEEARTKQWIGVHMSDWYVYHKTTAEIAAEYIDAAQHKRQGNPGPMKVFINKSQGDVYVEEIKATEARDWRACIVPPDGPHHYRAGEVPPWVQFLTLGQDSRATELHWALWGWGLIRDANGYPLMCGALIDCGLIERPHSLVLNSAELHVFDQLIYLRSFPRTNGGPPLTVKRGFHDSGWQPIAVYEYSRYQRRAHPVKGGDNDNSRTKAEPWKKGAPLEKYELPNGKVVHGSGVCVYKLNTFQITQSFLGMVTTEFDTAGPAGSNRSQRMIHLPLDVPEDYITQAAAEYMTTEKDHEVYKHRGPNHWHDCNVYAYAAALSLRPMQGWLPFDEHKPAQPKRPRPQRAPDNWITKPPGPWIRSR
jgi:phage terminase large subunit GpA-like protein